HGLPLPMGSNICSDRSRYAEGRTVSSGRAGVSQHRMADQPHLLTPPPQIERKKKESAALELIPERPTLKKLADAVQACTACDLYRDTTQAVFGEGTNAADAVFVGEQPGDQEDRQGRPFVGPAGRVLDEALEEVG